VVWVDILTLGDRSDAVEVKLEVMVVQLAVENEIVATILGNGFHGCNDVRHRGPFLLRARVKLGLAVLNDGDAAEAIQLGLDEAWIHNLLDLVFVDLGEHRLDGLKDVVLGFCLGEALGVALLELLVPCALSFKLGLLDRGSLVCAAAILALVHGVRSRLELAANLAISRHHNANVVGFEHKLGFNEHGPLLDRTGGSLLVKGRKLKYFFGRHLGNSP